LEPDNTLCAVGLSVRETSAVDRKHIGSRVASLAIYARGVI